MTDEEISLVKLISRAEDATEPSRDLDAEIALALGWTFTKMKGDKYPYWRKPEVTDYWDRSELPLFTKSIDVALTALPADRRIASMEEIFHDGSWISGAVSGDPPYLIYGKHKILPIAICIAALKARFV